MKRNEMNERLTSSVPNDKIRDNLALQSIIITVRQQLCANGDATSGTLHITYCMAPHRYLLPRISGCVAQERRGMVGTWCAETSGRERSGCCPLLWLPLPLLGLHALERVQKLLLLKRHLSDLANQDSSYIEREGHGRCLNVSTSGTQRCTSMAPLCELG